MARDLTGETTPLEALQLLGRDVAYKVVKGAAGLPGCSSRVA